MKKIVIIGDSISKGYTMYVRESLQKVATVCFPEENCMFSTYVLRKAHNWIEQLQAQDADLIHWNAGLWDTLQIMGDEPLVDMEAYAKNIERIIKRFRQLCPNAKIVFATSTPCMEEGFIRDYEYRSNSEIEKYNAAALAVCEKYGILVNDLYGLLRSGHEALHSDRTHYYTADGTEVIGNAVNKVICAALDIDESSLTVPDKHSFQWQMDAYGQAVYVKRRVH